jgi:hypothetical protein
MQMNVFRRGFAGVAVVLASVALQLSAFQSSHTAAELKNLPAGRNVLWSDPGEVESLDFLYGPGGAAGVPTAPFQFVEEDTSGTSPKVRVKDAAGLTWSVKWGIEAKPEIFCNRLVWGCGYFVETEYMVPSGTIAGAHDLKRAREWLAKDGSFASARFQLRADSPKFLSDHNWGWKQNPFVGTPQLNGLKVLMMLLSNWDDKDATDIDPTGRDKKGDSNLGIFQEGTGPDLRYEYLVADWGRSLGKWGKPPLHTAWDCKGYSSQNGDLVESVDNGILKWGYSGHHTGRVIDDIRVTDVQWLMQYLGRISDDQIRRGMAASGATPPEMECFLSALRERIERLRSLAGPPQTR